MPSIASFEQLCKLWSLYQWCKMCIKVQWIAPPGAKVSFFFSISNAPKVNSKLEKNRKHSVFWQTLRNVWSACKISLRNHIRGSRAKKTKLELQKAYVSNIFRASILFILPRLLPMWFCDEILHAQQTFVKVCHKRIQIFFEFLFYFTVRPSSIEPEPRNSTSSPFYHLHLQGTLNPNHWTLNKWAKSSPERTCSSLI